MTTEYEEVDINRAEAKAEAWEARYRILESAVSASITSLSLAMPASRELLVRRLEQAAAVEIPE